MYVFCIAQKASQPPIFFNQMNEKNIGAVADKIYIDKYLNVFEFKYPFLTDEEGKFISRKIGKPIPSCGLSVIASPRKNPEHISIGKDLFLVLAIIAVIIINRQAITSL